MSLKGKTIFITGASRGIGMAIGLRAAQDGANVVVAAKTTEPHPKLPGTIFSAAEAMVAAGGKALPLMVDIRDEAKVTEAVARTIETFGGIDLLVNNASAISLTGTLETPMKRFDLMHQINTRGTYMTTQACLPHLLKAENPHVLNISPPLAMTERWFKDHVAYTMAKFGMSMCVLGMAGEFRGRVGINALWPRTVIETAAVLNLLGGKQLSSKGRKPEIMADAAYAIFNRSAAQCTGNFFIDDEVLSEQGITDFSAYKVTADLPDDQLALDFFL